MSIFHRRARRVAREESNARIERAEEELSDLKRRGNFAIRTLEDRAKRNHWRESIEHMIQGAP